MDRQLECEVTIRTSPLLGLGDKIGTVAIAPSELLQDEQVRGYEAHSNPLLMQAEMVHGHQIHSNLLLGPGSTWPPGSAR